MDLLTFAVDSTWGIAPFLWGSGVVGLGGSIFAVAKQDNNPTALGRVGVWIGLLSTVGAVVAGAAMSVGGLQEGSSQRVEQVTTWLAEEHNLTLEPIEEGNPHRELVKGETVVAVDSNGEEYAVVLVPYEGTKQEGGDSWYLEDFITGEPFTADETVEEETDGEDQGE